MKKRLPFQYTDEKKLLMEPSIDMFLFYQSYNFVVLLSNRNQLTLLFYFHLIINLNFLDLCEGWVLTSHEDNSFLSQYLVQIYVSVPNLLHHFFEELTRAFHLNNIREQLQNLEVLYRLPRTSLYLDVLMLP